MAGRPERRAPPDAAPSTAPGPRGGVAGDGGGTGSPGPSPAPRRRPRPDRGHRPGPPSGPRPVDSPPGSPGSAPAGRASPARRRQREGSGEGGPRSSPPRRPVRPSLPPTGRPPRPDPATGGSGDEYAARGAESQTRHAEIADCPRRGGPFCPDRPAEGVPDMARRGPRGRGAGVRRSGEAPPSVCTPSVYPQIPGLTTPPKGRAPGPLPAIGPRPRESTVRS